jgi:hypothetical protein
MRKSLVTALVLNLQGNASKQTVRLAFDKIRALQQELDGMNQVATLGLLERECSTINICVGHFDHTAAEDSSFLPSAGGE